MGSLAGVRLSDPRTTEARAELEGAPRTAAASRTAVTSRTAAGPRTANARPIAGSGARPVSSSSPRRRGLRIGPSFAQHRRIDRLRELLSRHPRGVTLVDLGRMLAVDRRTVRRYLKEIEREYELSPLRPRGGGPCLWRIRPSELPRKMEIRRAQALALLATRGIFEALQGSALFDEIDMAMSKLRAFADRPGRGPNAGLANARLEERFVYLPRLTRDYSDKSEELDELFLAVSELRPLSLRYLRSEKARPGREEPLVIHPYALVLYGDCVHCVANQVATQEIRTFAFDRMTDLRALSEERFELPRNFRVQDHFHGELGALAPHAPVKVVLDLDARVARSARDVRWHPSQKCSALPGGGLRVTLAVDDPESVLAWVLGFGRAAQVVEPDALREAVQRELLAALEGYTKKK
jgi:predicted DNA-binding transcriptional regulator YafY